MDIHLAVAETLLTPAVSRSGSPWFQPLEESRTRSVLEFVLVDADRSAAGRIRDRDQLACLTSFAHGQRARKTSLHNQTPAMRYTLRAADFGLSVVSLACTPVSAPFAVAATWASVSRFTLF